MEDYYKEIVGSDTLKGDFITCYGIDDSMKYFYLRNGDTLHLLNKASIHKSSWSLGTLEKDFDSFFITRIDNGNDVPFTYQVFDKKEGKNLLGNNVVALDFKYLKDSLFFLYDNHTANFTGNYIDRKEADSIFIYNIKSGNRQGFKLPFENPTDIIYYDLIKITKNNLIISRQVYNSEKQILITYRR